MNFQEYLTLTEVQPISGLFVPESWHKEISLQLPKMDLDLPTVTRQGIIDIILDKKNPIYVQLSDGSKLFFTHDEYKRIQGKPSKGKKMTVVMQRHGQDNSDVPSQICKCMVT